jgi:hypothetical protein
MTPTYLDKPRAKAVIQGIFAAMESGAWFTRTQLIQRFIDGGYAEHLAVRRADALVAANTDIDHHSRWHARGTGTHTTYNFKPPVSS